MTSQKPNQSREVTILVFLVLIFFASVGATYSYAEIIPSDRRIDWNPGIPGGIPTRTTIFANVTDPPYNAAGDGTTDDTTAIQNAITACPQDQVIYFPAGTYRVTSGFTYEKGIVLRGDGPDSTIIRMTSSVPAGVFQVGQYRSSDNDLPQVPLTGGYTKDSTSLTIDTSDPDESGLIAGRYIIIAQSDGSNPLISTGNCTWTGEKIVSDYDSDYASMGQIVKIVSRNGSTLTISPELYYTYESGYHPFVSRADSGVRTEYAGFEDMKIERTASCSNPMGYMIYLRNTVYSWVKNVELGKMCGRTIRIYRSFGTVIRDSYWHEAFSYASGGTGYGVSLMAYSSNCLIENNIGGYYNKVMQIENAGGGNVIAYNYFDGSWLSTSPGWQNGTLGTHCSHPYMNLIEGNQFTKFTHDNVHGSASHFILLRNHIDSDDTFPCMPEHTPNDTQALSCIKIELGYYASLVGNILGQSSFPQHLPTSMTGYECQGTSCGTTSSHRWVYLFRTDDSDIWDTMIRHGNYDYYNNNVVWDESISDHNIPNSYYLNEKPSWWDDQGLGRPWPCIGPDISGYVIDIPAKDRFKGETYSPADDTTPPADVSAFTAAPGDGHVTLSWIKPTDDDFVGTMIRYRTDGTYPTDHNDGTLVCDRTADQGSNDGFVHSGLQNGTTYYYSAFTYDEVPNYSETAHASAAPTASALHRILLTPL